MQDFNGIISTNSVKEAIRIVDSKKSLEAYVKNKCKHNANFVDLEVRRDFNSKDVTASIIKCAHRCNHYGVRNAIINKNQIGNECPRCS